jgi:hypothetical protein
MPALFVDRASRSIAVGLVDLKNCSEVAAATLSLIGLTLEDGYEVEDDEVIFILNSWFVGVVLEAANDAGALRV